MNVLDELKNKNSKSKDFYDINLGILGGGQLGLMLIQAATNYNVHCYVLDSDNDAPCKAFSKEFIHGDLLDFNTVYNFGKKLDLITIEIEHVNVEALKKLASEGIKVFPQPEIIEMIQDKGLQKEFYKKNDIPTSDFILIEDLNDLKTKVNFLPAVQKLRKHGYDGRGVHKINSTSEIENGFNALSVLEKKVLIKKEISIIVSRNLNGEIKLFPPIELVFKDDANLVDYLFSPANINKEIENKANTIAKKIVQDLNFVGILAVEMFLTDKDEILVNEIAPRPHNSGHHTIEGNITSQFEQHLRAILNLPLGETDILMPSIMVNLLGEKGYSGEVKFENLEKILAISGVYVHLYGKKVTRENRKMGHITIIDKNLNSGLKKMELIKKTVRVIS